MSLIKLDSHICFCSFLLYAILFQIYEENWLCTNILLKNKKVFQQSFQTIINAGILPTFKK